MKKEIIKVVFEDENRGHVWFSEKNGDHEL